MKATRGDTNNTLLLLQLSTRLLFFFGSLSIRVWTFSFFHGSTRLKLAILQNHSRSFKSLQSLENRAIKGNRRTSYLLQEFILNDVGWVYVTGNVLKDYKFPGMLGKMHACAVSVYQAPKKSLGTTPKVGGGNH